VAFGRWVFQGCWSAECPQCGALANTAPTSAVPTSSAERAMDLVRDEEPCPCPSRFQRESRHVRAAGTAEQPRQARSLGHHCVRGRREADTLLGPRLFTIRLYLSRRGGEQRSPAIVDEDCSTSAISGHGRILRFLLHAWLPCGIVLLMLRHMACGGMRGHAGARLGTLGHRGAEERGGVEGTVGCRGRVSPHFDRAGRCLAFHQGRRRPREWLASGRAVSMQPFRYPPHTLIQGDLGLPCQAIAQARHIDL